MTLRNTFIAFGATLAFSGSAHAAPLILTGNYLQVSISDYGTFGRNGGDSPAFVHDPSGTGSFDLSTDYISPGSPHDGFSIVADQFAWTQNTNDGIAGVDFTSPTLLTGAAARGYANAATWTGTFADYFSVTNNYFFNAGDERVLIETSITALQDLTGLAFARSVDPDSGTTTSRNQRGNPSLGIDDFIGSESVENGRTLALVNVDSSGYRHTTSIQSNCCANQNPYTILNHTGGDLGLSSTGDDSLNLAYALGALRSGSTATVRYSYSAGLGIDVIPPPTAAVPEPATWAMMILGFGVAGGALRRRRRIATKAHFAIV